MAIAMLEETISKIQAQIESSTALDASRRAELLKLLGELHAEIAKLSKTHQEKAQNIASYTELSTEQATGPSNNPKSLAQSINRLEDSVREVETTHPQLVAIVNRISAMLSNMGI